MMMVSRTSLSSKDRGGIRAARGGEFGAAWDAEHTALIKAYVEVTYSTTRDMAADLDGLQKRFADGVERLAVLDARTDVISQQVREIRQLLSARQHSASSLSGEAIIDLSLDLSARLRNQLPDPVADFIGRDDQIRELSEDLVSGRSGLISAVRGMGGIGKTSLAAVVGHKIAATFPDGQFWIELKGTRPNAAMTTSAALGMRFHGSAHLCACSYEVGGLRIHLYLRRLDLGERVVVFSAQRGAP
jgi:hypothetical protein